MSIDFNTAQRNDERSNGDFEPIPKDEIVIVVIGQNGDNILKPNKARDARGLDLVFTVTDGKYARRKVWSWMGVTGNGSKGHDTMVDITKANIRAILESARGVQPSDETQEAMKARTINDWDDLIGMEFVARVGIEKGKGDYPDRNVLYAVTPNESDYAASGFKPKRMKSAAPRQPAMSTADAADDWMD